METPRLRSPLARALVPVLGGIGFFTLFFGGLWVVAIVINNRAEPDSVVANKVFEVGKVESLSESVATDGPFLLPDLKSPDGIRSLVLDHTGDDPANGWRVYYGYPADRDPSCLVTHVPGTREFVDCEDRTLAVEDLQPPDKVRPVVENRTTLFIDMRGITQAAATTVP